MAERKKLCRELPKAKSQCNDVSVAFWGDRIVCPDGAEFRLTQREA